MKPSPYDNPYYRNPKHPNYLRRHHSHDYRRPARYLITLQKAPYAPLMCRIEGSPVKPECILSEAGVAMEEALSEWLGERPMIEVPTYQVMPDHVHLCVDVRGYLNRHFAIEVGSLKGKVTRRLQAALDGLSFFDKSFNDRIAFTPEQWDRQKAYTRDNPRRLLIKRLKPNLYFSTWEIRIGDLTLHAKGNVMLLKNPELEVVRWSRKFKGDEFLRMVEGWKRTVENFGVLVSPFIHPKENEMRKYAFEKGGSVIRVCENPFSEKFYPAKEEFEFMHTSRLLLVAPADGSAIFENFYQHAQYLNGIARRIVAASWEKGEGTLREIRHS